MKANQSLPGIRYAPTDEGIFYPESDGKPLAETDTHRDLLLGTIEILRDYFRHIPDVYVSGNLMMYYVKGDIHQSISPDVFVTFGVERKQRRTYRIWEEGKAPDVVFEFSSKSTVRNDLGRKKSIYARIGVQEYFLHDPDRRYLPSPLMGFRLVDGDYVQIPPLTDGHLLSVVLGLELRLRGTGFALYDPGSSQWLATPAEQERVRAEQEAMKAEQEAMKAEREAMRAEQESLARQHAETVAQQEAAARRQAEAEVARLEAELARVKALRTAR